MKNVLGYFVITIGILSGSILLNCDKENSQSERFLLLTAHSWKYDTIITICQDPEIVGFIEMLNDAAKEATVIFGADESYVSPFENGKWKFSNGETEIITFDEDDPDDIYGHVRIDVLTDNILEITDLIDVPPSDTCFVKSKLDK